jgi:hypothetical protein
MFQIHFYETQLMIGETQQDDCHQHQVIEIDIELIEVEVAGLIDISMNGMKMLEFG